MGKSQRVKGRAYEQFIAREFRKLYDTPDLKEGTSTVRRGRQTHRADESDVVVDAGSFGCRLWVECAHGAAPSIQAKLKQAIGDSDKIPDRNLPIAITRRNRELDLVTMRLPDFMELLRAAEDFIALRAVEDFMEQRAVEEL